MKTRIVHTKIWKDSWFTSLPRASSRVFLYLLTCEANNLCGVFELTDRNIMFDTGVNSSELEQAKSDLKDKVIFFKDWIRLLNSEKYNNYVTNKKLQTAYEKEMAIVPQEVIEYIDKYDTSMDTSIDTSIYTPNNHKSKTINQKSKIKNSGFENLRNETGHPSDQINESDLVEISNSYNLPLSFVKSKFDDVIIWYEEKPNDKSRRGRNWKATLRNWVKRDAIEIKKGGSRGKSKISFINPS